MYCLSSFPHPGMWWYACPSIQDQVISVMFYSCWFAGFVALVLYNWIYNIYYHICCYLWVGFVLSLFWYLNHCLFGERWIHATYSKTQSGQKQIVRRYGYILKLNIYKICAQKFYCFHKICKKSVLAEFYCDIMYNLLNINLHLNLFGNSMFFLNIFIMEINAKTTCFYF